METISEAKDLAISKRRRAVYTALAPFFDHDNLFRALWIWEEKYAHAQPMKLRQFVAEITADRYPVSTVSRLHVQLVAANFIKNINKLEPDPYEEMVSYREATQRTRLAPPETVVFEVLCNHMTGDLEAETISTVFKLFANHLRVMPLGLAQKLELEQWIGSCRAVLHADYSRAELQDMLHALYVAICSVVGPVDTDRLLEKGVQAAGLLPEAQQFSPQMLL